MHLSFNRRLIATTLTLAVLSGAAFAQNTTPETNAMAGEHAMGGDMGMEGGMSMSIMGGGEVVAIMPDGHMGTMTIANPADVNAKTKEATAIDRCMMFMTGTDGKTYAVDTSTEAGRQECEKIAL